MDMPNFDGMKTAARKQSSRPAGTTSGDWPEPFFEEKGSIWYRPPAKKKGEDSEPIWVCKAFRIVAEVVSEHGDNFGLLINWSDRHARPRSCTVLRRLLHASGNAIAEQLADGGLDCNTGASGHELLKQLLNRVASSNRMQCVSRPGWHMIGNRHVYVLPSGEAIGVIDGAGVVLQENLITDATPPRGTLEAWKEEIAAYGIGNHRLALGISMSFAGPLLDLTGDTTCGVHLVGHSHIGKTTITACAASVWGRGATTNGYIRTWSATSNGMENVAESVCDGLLPLDELAMVDALHAGTVVYSLAAETGKARMARDISARPRKHWRVIFLSTGEITLAVKMGERGATPMAGQEVRMINIPADAGAGMGAFQDLHEMDNGAALAVHLTTAAKSATYGTAAQAFLEKLVEKRNADPERAARDIHNFRAAFCKKVLNGGEDGQVQSVARRFALFAAAGEMAAHWKILPWPKGEAEKAAIAAFNAWIKQRGGTGAAEKDSAISRVRLFIELHGSSRFTELLKPDPKKPDIEAENLNRTTINRAGYRRGVDIINDLPTKWEFLIFPEVWKSEICKGID
jgi:putative DNA primase/helicase